MLLSILLGTLKFSPLSLLSSGPPSFLSRPRGQQVLFCPFNCLSCPHRFAFHNSLHLPSPTLFSSSNLHSNYLVRHFSLLSVSFYLLSPSNQPYIVSPSFSSSSLPRMFLEWIDFVRAINFFLFLQFLKFESRIWLWLRL